MSHRGKSYTIELDDQDVASLLFFVAERRWRARLASRSGELPVPEQMAYRAEIRQLDHLDAKLLAARGPQG